MYIYVCLCIMQKVNKQKLIQMYYVDEMAKWSEYQV